MRLASYHIISFQTQIIEDVLATPIYFYILLLTSRCDMFSLRFTYLREVPQLALAMFTTYFYRLTIKVHELHQYNFKHPFVVVLIAHSYVLIDAYIYVYKLVCS
jgi:hypothetical protein